VPIEKQTKTNLLLLPNMKDAFVFKQWNVKLMIRSFKRTNANTANKQQ